MRNIGIIGIGKLGLCFALNLERSGFIVHGTDVNENYIAEINSKTFFSHEPSVNEFIQKSQNFTAGTSVGELLSSDPYLVFISVATPAHAQGGYDHAQIERVVDEIKIYGVQKSQVHLVIVCTVTPGYCDELAKHLQPYNYSVSYNPEFIAQGNIIENQLYPDQILIGEGCEEAGNRIEYVYSQLCKSTPSIHRMDRLSAEIAKLATNCFLTTKIAFANSIGDLAMQVGADPHKILSAIGADSRVGEKYLKYGFGFGGPCLPRDNRALGYYAKTQNFELLIGESTDELNHRHLKFQTTQYLNSYAPTETIEIEGITFKPGSIMLDESQKLLLALELVKAGRKVRIADKQIVIDQINNLYPGIFETTTC